MLSALAWVILGILLANCQGICQIIHRLFAKSELYAHDRESRLLNLDPPATRWMNLGWWETTDGSESFPVAAERLARKLYDAVGLQKGERVCDVGFGSGESVRLLAQEFAPARLLGVTSLPHQHQRAVELLAQTNLDSSRHHLTTGDAATTLDQVPPHSADAVFALDCAYHFDTRQRFFRSAHTLLAPSGRLALTDLILPARHLSTLELIAIRLLFFVAGIPRANLVTPKQYTATLQRLGYEDIQLDDISEHVFPGYSAFIARRDAEMGDLLHPGHWGGLLRYTRIVRWYANLAGGGRRPKLAFVMVTARKPAA